MSSYIRALWHQHRAYIGNEDMREVADRDMKEPTDSHNPLLGQRRDPLSSLASCKLGSMIDSLVRSSVQ